MLAASLAEPLRNWFPAFAKLTYNYLPELLWWLGGPAAWAFQALRLATFVVLLLPGFIPQAIRYWFTSPYIWSCSYGASVRHRLDVYVPLGPDGKPLSFPDKKDDADSERAAVPIVVFVTGGAWIIGYRMWGFLIGFALQKRGVTCVSVDYRNFPQARVPEMVDDVSSALEWVRAHAAQLGGSADDITLVGQSAGAHLSAMVLLRLMRRPPAARAPLRRFIGISGPYDMPRIKESLSRRGLHPGLIDSLACGDLQGCSPSLLLPASTTRRRGPSAVVDDAGGGTGSNACSNADEGTAAATPHDGRPHDRGSSVACEWPPIVLFHGTADQTVPCEQSREFAARLRACGAAHVTERYYDDKSHTDPILEDPLRGGDLLMADMLDLLLGPAERAEELQSGLWPSGVPARHSIIWLAKCINPF